MRKRQMVARRDERTRLEYEVVRRKAQGHSQRAISRAVGIARDTVKAILERQAKRREEGESAIEREVGRPPTPRPSKLDEYEQDIAGWLTQYEDLTAVRLRELLQGEGFEGGYTIVRERLKELRAERQPVAKAYEVVETPPGHQGQFDWSPYELEGDLKVQLWDFTLSWSRGRSFQAEENTQQTTVFNCLSRSFEELGGVPREGVTDSMPGIVDGWECNRPILNLRFVNFAVHYNLVAHIAPRRCGRYKGKVERPFWYAELNLLNGRRFHSLAQFREVLAWWTREKAMKRPHPVTHRPIWEMLAEERPYLQPLPARPYDTRDVAICMVDAQGYVRFETNFYRVPDEHVGALVYVCVAPDKLEAFDRALHRLAEHARLPDGAGLRSAGEKGKRPRGRYDVTLLCERVGELGEGAEEFAERLRSAKRFPGPELSYILGLQLTWSGDDIAKALVHALKYDAYDAHAVERILQARFRPRSLAQQIAESTRARVGELMRDHPVVQRPLNSYESLRLGDSALEPTKAERTDEPEEPAVE
jgi:transposase